MNLYTAKGFSNIALIKYMGKSNTLVNEPTNASLSLTLPKLFTEVQLEVINSNEDQWSALEAPGLLPFQISEKGKAKYLNFFKNLKKEFAIEKSFLIRSANNFPADCGIASSASSFSALTIAFSHFLYSQGIKTNSLELALLSKKGSGSSCRSFFGPWTYWKGNEVSQRKFSFIPGWHQAIILDSKAKSVSSSEAHLLVASSQHFAGRVDRAERRLEELSALLSQVLVTGEQWQRAFKICWDEFMDMHHLFHTAKSPFFYWSENSIVVLKYIADFWEKNGDGPLVTMDAGPNVHFIYRKDQEKLKQKITFDLQAKQASYGLQNTQMNSELFKKQSYNESQRFSIIETEIDENFRI